jgi:quercetin 2,3-dioxygenase
MTNHKIRNISTLGFPWATKDPFLFCVHHKDDYPKGDDNFGPDKALLKNRNIGSDFDPRNAWRMYHGEEIPGFPYHPHRGFETVTVAIKGVIDHADSLGAAGRFRDGDVQWMTAGKGVLHAETFPLLNKDTDNPLELFQIWLNLPAKSKFVEPHFKMLWSEDIPTIEKTDENGRTTKITLIAGKLQDTNAPITTPDSWAAEAENEVAIWSIEMAANSTWTLPKASPGLNRTIYFYRGDTLQVETLEVPNYHLIELKSDEDILLEAGNTPCFILLLQGKPINEPVAQHGPFVMNTRAEIQQAFQDYQRTQFGGWDWSTPNPVHGRDFYRFAKHGDGTLVVK